MENYDALVIGGGASGLLAAIVAKDRGANVAVLEGGARVARKILVTGNGRCNFSNTGIKPPYPQYHSKNKGFYTKVLNKLTVQNTLDLFYTLGLTFVELEKGRLYPESLQASGVVDLLRINAEERNIPVYLNSKVINIEKKDNYFLIETNNDENKIFKSLKVLVACGGLAAPETGSDGSIHPVLTRLGHKIVKPLPSIVQLKLDYKYLSALTGVRFDAMAKAFVNGKEQGNYFDEVLFTDYGISGPAILQISRFASVAMDELKEVKVALDLFKDKTENELMNFFMGHFALFSNRSVYNSLIGIIHKKLLPVLLKESGIDNIHKTCESLSYEEKRNFCKLLKHWEFICSGTNGLKNAQTTIGGVDTTDVDDETLESKIVKGLYFSGEVLDVDGDCGGFNLQWAWSSGYTAGINIG